MEDGAVRTSTLCTVSVISMVFESTGPSSTDVGVPSRRCSGTYGRRRARVNVVFPNPDSPTSMILNEMPVRIHSDCNWLVMKSESRERVDIGDGASVRRRSEVDSGLHSLSTTKYS